MKYFQLKSLTWWSAVAEGAINMARLLGYEVPPQIDGVIAAAFGVGLRGAIGKK